MNFKKLEILIFAVFLFGLQSCEDSFYTRTTWEDCYYLPLVKPYSLINPSSEEQIWSLKFKEKEVHVPMDGILLTEIQYENGVVFGKCADAKCNSGEEYLLIDIDNNKEYVFASELLWIEKLKLYNLDPNNLLNIWDVYNLYCEDKDKIPWLVQVDGQSINMSNENEKED